MEIAIGRIIRYTLSESDAAEVNRRRTMGASIAERMHRQVGTDRLQWPVGAQAHIGIEVRAGEVFPMIVTSIVTPIHISGQVFLDGTDTLWVRCVIEGREGRDKGTWAWPNQTPDSLNAGF